VRPETTLEATLERSPQIRPKRSAWTRRRRGRNGAAFGPSSGSYSIVGAASKMDTVGETPPYIFRMPVSHALAGSCTSRKYAGVRNCHSTIGIAETTMAGDPSQPEPTPDARARKLIVSKGHTRLPVGPEPSDISRAPADS